MRVALDRDWHLTHSRRWLEILGTRTVFNVLVVNAVVLLTSHLNINLGEKKGQKDKITTLTTDAKKRMKYCIENYQVWVGGELFTDAQRTAARSHARRDAPVRCVAPARAAAVTQVEAGYAESIGERRRKWSSQLHCAALHPDGLLQRPS